MKSIWKIILIVGGIIFLFLLFIIIQSVELTPENNFNITENYSIQENISKPIQYTFWELGKLPYAYEYLMFESCNDYGLKDKIISEGCVITNLETTYRWERSGDFNPPETHEDGTCESICIDKNWLARLPSDEPLKVVIYYDFNKYGGGNPKVIETEIIR